MGLGEEIRRTTLRNAVAHGGKTRGDIILAKILGRYPKYRSQARDVLAEITDIVDEINKMPAERQRSELEALGGLQAPRRSASSNQTISDMLPPLENVKDGVVTRFPPEPSGYPHIGHAKAALINEGYAARYGGKKILRMDDTNPEGERLEYYAAIKVGLDWLGIKYDTIKNTSDDMDLLYSKGTILMESGRAYVCLCRKDAISRNRREGIACRCSKADPSDVLDRWERMFTRYKPGDAAARYRGDMGSANTVMRDPVIFRILDARHPLTLDRYRVWPSYDLAVSVEDSVDGVTHALRSKEYELRNELYRSILAALGMRIPEVAEFSRLEFEGMPVSKRVLRPLIEDQKVAWYDDPRLPTLEAMKRRGIRPEAIRMFIASLGFTKSNTMAPFDALEAFNRRVVDASSVRLHMVRNPREIHVSGIPKSPIHLTNHPTLDLGSRTLAPEDVLFLPGDDVDEMRPGMHIRLMGLGNVRISDTGGCLRAEYVGDRMAGYPIIQWVPQNVAHRIKLIIVDSLFRDGRFNEESLIEEDVLVEPQFLMIPNDAEIQFVRFGYCRKESGYRAIMTHK